MFRLLRKVLASILSLTVGISTFAYNPVGNRKQITSTLPPVPAGLFNYDANDRFTAGDTYDANGNTVTSGGITNVYDFENHLIQQGGISIVYDGDGNRVQKTVAGVITKYLVDDRNPTGYTQVFTETTGSTTRQYVLGLERVSERIVGGTTATRFYDYDGHGSVRALTDTTGNVTDTYDYDAFGNLIHSTGTTPNNYLYSGEQFDPDLHLYYNRARYLNVSTGRFWTMDCEDGDPHSPQSLHKYLYASADAVNRVDPSGNEDFTIVGLEEGQAVGEIIDATPVVQGTVILAFLVAEFSGGIVETPDVSTPDTKRDPRYPNRMRVQLQEGVDNTFYGISQYNTEQVGVTVLQMRSALLTLYNTASSDSAIGRSAFPFNALNDWLMSSVIIASQKLGTYPPGGIFVPKRNFVSIPTVWHRGKEYRLDVDNLAGHNLRQ